MEAVIVVVLALFAIVVLEAGYCLALCLARWSPVLVLGAIVGWLAHRQGFGVLEAIGSAILACLLARHLLRRCWRLECCEYHCAGNRAPFAMATRSTLRQVEMMRSLAWAI